MSKREMILRMLARFWFTPWGYERWLFNRRPVPSSAEKSEK